MLLSNLERPTPPSLLFFLPARFLSQHASSSSSQHGTSPTSLQSLHPSMYTTPHLADTAVLCSCPCCLTTCTAALLHCCTTHLLHCCTAALLHCYTAALLNCTTHLLHHTSAALLHCCTAALLHCCTAALLHCCTAALLHRCTAALLHCCTAALLHCCTAAPATPLHCCTTHYTTLATNINSHRRPIAVVQTPQHHTSHNFRYKHPLTQAAHRRRADSAAPHITQLSLQSSTHTGGPPPSCILLLLPAWCFLRLRVFWVRGEGAAT